MSEFCFCTIWFWNGWISSCSAVYMSEFWRSFHAEYGLHYVRMACGTRSHFDLLPLRFYVTPAAASSAWCRPSPDEHGLPPPSPPRSLCFARSASCPSLIGHLCCSGAFSSSFWTRAMGCNHVRRVFDMLLGFRVVFLSSPVNWIAQTLMVCFTTLESTEACVCQIFERLDITSLALLHINILWVAAWRRTSRKPSTLHSVWFNRSIGLITFIPVEFQTCS